MAEGKAVTRRRKAGAATAAACLRAVQTPGDWRVWAVLLAGFLVLIVGLLTARPGIYHAGDTPEYLQSAANLAQGLAPVGKRTSYIAYAVVIMVFQQVRLGLPGVVALQVALAIVAAFALFDLGRKMAGPLAGYVAVALFLWNPDLVRWHVYILTESLYISMVILVVWSVHRSAERATAATYGLAAALLGPAVLMRPNGWMLVPVVAGYWIAASGVKRATKVAACVGVIAVFLAVMTGLPHFRQGIGAEGPVDRLFRGEVLWTYDPWSLTMPPPPEGRRMEDVGLYITAHPVACTRLALARVGAELWHARPFYSRHHNVAIWLFYPIMYVLMLAALPTFWRCRLGGLCAAMVVAQFLVVALTFADRDGRFLLHVFPLMGLFAAVTVARCADPVLSRASGVVGNGNLEENETVAS